MFTVTNKENGSTVDVVKTSTEIITENGKPIKKLMFWVMDTDTGEYVPRLADNYSVSNTDTNPYVANVADSASFIAAMNNSVIRDIYVTSPINLTDDVMEFTDISNKTIHNLDLTSTINVSVTNPTYQLTIATNGDGFITTGSSGMFESGQSIPIDCEPNDDYEFVNWTSSDGGSFANANNPQTSFTMPANATTITANFAPIETGRSPLIDNPEDYETGRSPAANNQNDYETGRMFDNSAESALLSTDSDYVAASSSITPFDTDTHKALTLIRCNNIVFVDAKITLIINNVDSWESAYALHMYECNNVTYKGDTVITGGNTSVLINDSVWVQINDSFKMIGATYGGIELTKGSSANAYPEPSIYISANVAEFSYDRENKYNRPLMYTDQIRSVNIHNGTGIKLITYYDSDRSQTKYFSH